LQDITQAGQAQGGLIDTAQNVTAKSIPNGLITVAIKGSPAIFNRQSASSFYIDIEQLSVMHFLDSDRYQTILGLVRGNAAYSVVTNPSSGRPHIEFTSAARVACGTTGLSCVLHNNIYNKLVNRPTAVHSLATGINTTSLEGSRDWLLSNMLRATDEYSTELATNMTDLVRSNFAVNDRVNKAWFINPGNRWNVPLSGGAQSSLLLTDKLILFAVITLNDGAGNILRRRLLSFSPGGGGDGSVQDMTLHEDREIAPRRALLQAGSVPGVQSDESIIASALGKITREPRVGTFPPIDYNVDIPATAAAIFGVENRAYTLLNVDVYGRFDDLTKDTQYIGDEFFRRLSQNLPLFCPDCEQVFPVFNNVMRGSEQGWSENGGRRRNLLQTANTTANTQITGSYSILLVYDSSILNKPIYYADISRAVYNSTFTPVWAGSTDEATVQKFIDSLASDQFVVRRVSISGATQ
jgi:hypothetical protein